VLRSNCAPYILSRPSWLPGHRWTGGPGASRSHSARNLVPSGSLPSPVIQRTLCQSIRRRPTRFGPGAGAPPQTPPAARKDPCWCSASPTASTRPGRPRGPGRTPGPPTPGSAPAATDAWAHGPPTTRRSVPGSPPGPRQAVPPAPPHRRKTSRSRSAGRRPTPPRTRRHRPPRRCRYDPQPAPAQRDQGPPSWRPLPAATTPPRTVEADRSHSGTRVRRRVDHITSLAPTNHREHPTRRKAPPVHHPPTNPNSGLSVRVKPRRRQSPKSLGWFPSLSRLAA
jgi:hypothetical protein